MQVYLDRICNASFIARISSIYEAKGTMDETSNGRNLGNRESPKTTQQSTPFVALCLLALPILKDLSHHSRTSCASVVLRFRGGEAAITGPRVGDASRIAALHADGRALACPKTYDCVEKVGGMRKLR